MAELGQTTNPRELIPGDPEAIINDLRELVKNIEAIGATGDGLGNVDPGEWTGDAATAFRDVFTAEPPKWFQAVDTANQGGQTLADYADTLVWAQGEAQRAIEMYTEAQAASRAAAAQYNEQAQAASQAGMAATIPVPIEFSLPEGWRSVNPDSVDASGLGFVAVHPGTSGAFRANITISGELRESHVPLAEVADEAVERLRAENPSVEVGRREQTGSAENPALTQVVRLRVASSGKPVQVYQLQVLLGMQDQRDRSRRAVLHVVLSALPAQFAQLIGDFEEFLATIRPEGANS